VRFVGLHAYGELRVPSYRCEGCGIVHAAPELVNCWPSAPEDGSTWFDEQLLDLFYRLHNGAGLSFAAFKTAGNAIIQEVFDMLPTDSSDVTDVMRDFTEAYR
jgi:hypothetical protein